MKRCLLVLTLSFAFFTPFAQNRQQQKNDSTCSLVKKYFNQKNSDALYALAGTNFRKALTPEVFRNVCNNNLFPLGEMKQTIFETYENGISKYKAEFAPVNLLLLIGLDKDDKLETLLFQPYIDSKATKNEKAATDNKLVSALDKAIDAAVQPYISRAATVGLSISILQNGQQYFYNYGETVKGNKQLPNVHTLFEIGSITKTFTSILLANAVNTGLVKLDDPVNRYLPDSIGKLQFDGVPVTLKTLANHTSGLPRMPDNFQPADNDNPYKDYYDRNMFSFLKNYSLTRQPGSKYEYSNLAVGLLGVILEKVNHKSYQALVLEKICNPLSMQETKEFLEKNDSAMFAKGYDASGAFSSQWDFKAMQAAGSIRSSSSDMLKYANACLGNAPANLNKDILLTQQVTYTEGSTKIGLGWHFIKPGTDEVIFHNGQTGGYHGYLATDHQKKFAVIILSNCALGTEDVGGNIIKWLEKQ